MTAITDNSSGINMQLLAQRIIRQAIQDLIDPRHTKRCSAHTYIGSELFELHRDLAQYPIELRDTLADLVLRSKAAQKILSTEILDLLADTWDTRQRKTPSLGGG